MKKGIAWAIVLLLLLSAFAGCKDNGQDPNPISRPTAEPIVTPAPTEEADEEYTEVDVDPSEWETAESPALTEETLALFQKAFTELLGVRYVPVAYLGKQVVAGTVHTFLTRATVVYPGAREMFALVFLYEDRDKNVTIMDVIMSGVRTYTDMAMGGWTRAESPVVTEELSAAFQSAFAEFFGASYAPVALLSTQPVSGVQYCIFCESGTVTADPNAGYAFVYLYTDADGATHISSILDFMGS